eukprot:6182879-Pleurochrysis_carterae.AAC.2
MCCWQSTCSGCVVQFLALSALESRLLPKAEGTPLSVTARTWRCIALCRAVLDCLAAERTGAGSRCCASSWRRTARQATARWDCSRRERAIRSSLSSRRTYCRTCRRRAAQGGARARCC